MDKTILDLFSLLIAGGGLFAVLTKFNVPQLRATYFNENPYALKRDEIDRVMTWLFTGMAGIGIVVQFLKLAIFYDLPERSYGAAIYSLFFGLGILIMVVALFAVAKIGYWIAKRRWFPKTVESQEPLYQTAKFILEHDGWREDQWEKRADLSGKEKYVAANMDTVCKYLNQIEDLLDCPSGHIQSKDRIRRLARFFQK
jgi:hypothetical protein